MEFNDYKIFVFSNIEIGRQESILISLIYDSGAKISCKNRDITLTNSILLCSETITQEPIEFTDYKIFTLTHSFNSGCILTVLRTEALGTLLLTRWLSIPKILGLNPGISGRKEEILGSVFILKRAHRVETEFTNIE